MANNQIIPIKVGEVYLDYSSVCYAVNPGQKVRSPVLVFLIRTPEETILVDTGCCDENQAKQYHIPVKITLEDNLQLALQKNGVSPEMIRTVILTHLHWDHCYHNNLFPNAEFYVQKKEVDFAEAPYPCQCRAYEAEVFGLKAPWLNSRERFHLIDGDLELREGITLLLLPGHTPGSMGVLVETSKGSYLIAGDLIQSKVVFDHMECGLPKPSGVHSHLDAYYGSLKKAMDLKAEILPGHEMDVLKYPIYPPETD